MKKISEIALILSLLASPLQASNLRSKRNLQLITAELLNAIIDTYIAPPLENILQTVLGYGMDPLHIEEERTHETREIEIPLPPGGFLTCKTSATITYGLATIEGLSSIELEALGMVEGSDEIQLFSTGGAEYNGTWLVNASLDTLRAETTASLSARACGIPIEQTVLVTATTHNASLQASLTLGGHTTSLTSPSDTTNVTTAHVQELDLQLGVIDAKVQLIEGNLIPDMSLERELEALMLNGLIDDLEERILNRLNDALAAELPIDFSNV